MNNRVAIASIRRVGAGRDVPDQELVAVEAPLTLEIARQDRHDWRSVGIFMRTPGHDEDLVRGFLFAEGVIRTGDDVVAIEDTGAASAASDQPALIRVTVRPGIDIDAVLSEPARVISSACGLCGRLGLESLDSRAGRPVRRDYPRLAAETVTALPAALRKGQPVFAETGGLHAAGLFDIRGQLLALREDVGRHNAVDKVVGAALASGWLPATEAILTVSGRIAFEIVQKASLAGIPIVVAIGAPSSLAVDAARRLDLTLAGFTRDGRFNLYSGFERIT